MAKPTRTNLPAEIGLEISSLQMPTSVQIIRFPVIKTKVGKIEHASNKKLEILLFPNYKKTVEANNIHMYDP